MHGIRHVNLKSSEMQELQTIMSKGNTLLKECAAMMNMTGGEFRGQLFNKILDISKLSPEQIQKIEAAKPFIMAVREKCEYRLINGFAKMVYKQAKAAASNVSDAKNAFYEFEQVGTLALLDCIYGYTDINIKFITYVWNSVRRRINNTINRLNPFCPLTNEAMNLIQNFNETKLKLNRPVNAEEVIEIMGLTPDKRAIFFAATTKVINQKCEKKNSSDYEENSDYTALRRGIDKDLQVNIGRQEVRQAIKNAELSNIELHLLLGEMFPYTGWREDIASRFINPKTGKRYTREVTGILERAKKKVKDVYLSPPEESKENPLIDHIFDEMSGSLV